MNDITVTCALRVGSDLLREEELPPAEEIEDLDDPEGVYGAVVVEVDGEEVLDERYWDRLDVVLERLLDAIDEAASSNEGVAEFPDTRLEVVLRTAGESDSAVLEVEDTSVELELPQLRLALSTAVERFIEMVDGRQSVPSSRLDRLRDLVAA